jgi:hypothetical protein
MTGRTSAILLAHYGHRGLLQPLCRVGGSVSCHSHTGELEGPEGAVPADAFEATDGDKITGVTQGGAHALVCKVVAMLRGTAVAKLQRTDDMRGDGLWPC